MDELLKRLEKAGFKYEYVGGGEPHKITHVDTGRTWTRDHFVVGLAENLIERVAELHKL
jgi:hypothetical protein